jgi:hypothetical protein
MHAPIAPEIDAVQVDSSPQRGGVRGGEKQQALRLWLHPTPSATDVAGDPPRLGRVDRDPGMCSGQREGEPHHEL